ncbi:GLPGLI family protein [Aquimarina sp. W85]|uniref:GLPGLI family protein n=1 Tax=Aquimarina rhodophyticola TaxID=3342246 RepID=UPI003672245C
MKKYIILLFIFVIAQNFAQKNSKGIVTYSQVINNPDGSRFASPYKLYFDANRSFFERLGTAKRMDNEFNKKNNSTGQQVSSTILKTNLPLNYYYTNTLKNILIFRENVVMKNYIVKDSMEVLPWKLHKDQKKVSSYTCQKATTDYRGRQWTVWFTTEIPITHGPWKLRGLPGLILEANEASGKYEFIAHTIRLDPNDKIINDTLKIPNTTDMQDMEIYKMALKNKDKDLSAMVLATLPRGGKVRRGCDTCPDRKNFNLEIYE